jgi:hypothetical protein
MPDPADIHDMGPFPATYRASVDKAQARAMRRGHGPVVSIDPDTNELANPFEEERADWEWMIIDTFGTRCHQVAYVFIAHLVGLCASTWNEKTDRWVPNQDELTTLLHIIAANRPRNEAEAALAAQIAATHMILMKVAKRAADHPWDTRTVSTFAKLAKTSAMQIDTMAGLKGKRRTTRQQINVVHEKHVHHHQHVHVGGVEKSEGQCDATRTGAQKLGRARVAGKRPAVPGEDETGRVVPLQGRAR